MFQSCVFLDVAFAGECYRATLALPAGYLYATITGMESLMAPAYRHLKLNMRSSSAKEDQKSLESIGLVLVALLIIPQCALGWGLKADLQLVLPFTVGLVMNGPIDTLTGFILLRLKGLL